MWSTRSATPPPARSGAGGRYAAWQVAAPLAGDAGVLELGQLLVPGRHAGIDDFLFSAAGAVAGAVARGAAEALRSRRQMLCLLPT